MVRRERQEMIPVACHHYGLSSVRKGEDGTIVGITRKEIAESRDGVPRLHGDAPNSLGDIIVQQKGHATASAIWRATR